MLRVKSILRYLLGPAGMRLINKARNYICLRDIYRTKSRRRVLISYIKEPFVRASLKHTNFFEVQAAAKIFNDLGYSVDVMHYDGRIPRLDMYDVIYGFGDVFQIYFERGGGRAKTIYYGAGMHVCHQNNATLKRLREVYRRRDVWLCSSARYVEKTWTHQTALVDGIIALGNDTCAATYKAHYDGPVLECPAPFFRTIDYKVVMAKREAATRNSYLWFGSAGLIHKGLDLCLDYFKMRRDLDLHVCGNLSLEPDFTRVFHAELFETPNIHVHGFIDVRSKAFEEILSSCSFVVFPSCSEGGSPSVLTAIGNGALIPVVSRESSVTAEHGIIIEYLTPSGFADAIEKTLSISDEQVLARQSMSAKKVMVENSLESYELALKSHITSLLKV